MKESRLEQKEIENISKKYKKLLPKWAKFIDEGFLPDPMENEYKTLINQKYIQIQSDIQT